VLSDCFARTKNYFHGHVDETLTELGIHNVRSRDILNVVDGFKGRGYGMSTGLLVSLRMNIAHGGHRARLLASPPPFSPPIATTTTRSFSFFSSLFPRS
jgi:hypothetical protein